MDAEYCHITHKLDQKQEINYVVLFTDNNVLGTGVKIFLTFVRKHSEMTFLTSRSVSKHILFALGVDPTARDAAGEGGGSDLVSQATPFAVWRETSNRPCSLATQV